ncbi:MAG: aldolase/citrate lyase family protein [Candidatus Omnitrophota bacterium]|nr:aldolase/citrate lyase family protein [Candidatus Omnitrophota bacterium]
MIDLKARLKANKLTIGSWITLASPAIPEIMARCGFDWLTVDMEHSAITIEIAQDLIRIIGLSGVVPLVRVGKNDPNLIKRVMDAGAHGVIVPMVNSPEDAERAVSAVKYPPVGKRGVGLARAQGYGLEFGKYKNWVNKKSVVVVQVEHIDAVESLEGILATPGVDAFIVGPYDLSASLGRPGEFEHPDVKAALKEVISVSKRMNKCAGFHVIPPDSRLLAKKSEEGYRFLGFSLDTLFLGRSCMDETTAARRKMRR